jgi:hypothetical protein
MKTPPLPGRLEVIRDLHQLLPVLVRAAEAAVERGREFFQNYEHAPFDRNLFPSLFRYYAKRELKKAGHEATDEEESSLFQERDIPNNGLLLMSGEYEIRILKSYEGQLPPANSERRRDFYNQTRWRSRQTALPGMPTSDSKRVVARSLCLVILWDVTPRFELQSIELVCPNAIGADGLSVKEHWRETLQIGEPLSVAQEAAEQEGDLPVIPKEQPSSADAGADHA